VDEATKAIVHGVVPQLLTYVTHTDSWESLVVFQAPDWHHKGLDAKVILIHNQLSENDRVSRVTA